MPAPLPKTLAPSEPGDDIQAAPLAPVDAECSAVAGSGSPARQMQWELHRRIELDAGLPDVQPYAPALRVALLVGGGLGAWGVALAIARLVIRALG